MPVLCTPSVPVTRSHGKLLLPSRQARRQDFSDRIAKRPAPSKAPGKTNAIQHRVSLSTQWLARWLA
ncbi:hypothetical protein [Arthrobacter sp. NyZ413]|uniref:hypothetical protein n=1 Tax=Arthrobacter sp. NyZ413 TaxID=3144669 RepID=UPI003BF786E6